MDEITALKSEIDRLNRIITVLVEEISTIRTENKALKNRIGTKDHVYAIPENDNGTNTEGSTIPEKGNGANDVGNTVPEKGNGTTDNTSTITEKSNGRTIDGSTITEKGTGTNINPERASVSAPTVIEINDLNAFKLSRDLARLFAVSVKRSKLISVARELLLLHNQGFASHNELRKISGLSKPGYAKHAPSLRRAGLTYRHSFQKYALTEKSKQMINRIFGKA